MKSKTDFPKLKYKALLAPMSGVTDVAFRHLSRKYGAGLTTTEFVSATALSRKNPVTEKMLVTSPLEKPKATQIFGSDINDMILAGKFLEKKFDIIDVNCGCPVKKVMKTGAGSSLLKNPDNLAKIMNKLVTEINVPVTAKIRIGLDKKMDFVSLAKKLEDAGIAALTVHGRIQKQKYSGTADWTSIKKIKSKLNIPVIGNGDVFSPEICKKRIEESEVDYVLLGRGAIGNPYLFSQINDFLKKGSYDQPNKLKLLNEYLKLAEKYKLSFPVIKSQSILFTKGLIDSSALRMKLHETKSLSELKCVLDELKI